jgi:hypothetical protein
MRWSDVLCLADGQARTRAALAALMWQAAANAADEAVTAQATFQASISLEGLADTLDHYKVPVLPSALTLVDFYRGGTPMPIGGPV